MPDQGVDRVCIFKGRRAVDLRGSLRQTGKACPDGAVVRKNDPIGRQTGVRLDQAGEQRGDLRAGDGMVRRKAAAGIHADKQSLLVHPEDLRLIRGIIIDIRNKITADIGVCDQLRVAVVIPFLRQGSGEDACHLRTGRRRVVMSKRDREKPSFRKIGKVGVEPVCRVRAARKIDRRVSVLIGAAQTRRERQQLSYGDAVLRRKAALSAPLHQTVFIGGCDGAGIPAGFGHVVESGLIRARAGKWGVVCG